MKKYSSNKHSKTTLDHILEKCQRVQHYDYKLRRKRFIKLSNRKPYEIY